MLAELKLPQETNVSERFNLVSLTECGRFAVDKTGQLTAVIEAHANMSDGLNYDRYNQLFAIRKQAFELLGEDFYFSVHSTRKRKEYSEKSTIQDKTIRALSNKWNDKFKNTYQTKHYLILTTKNKTLLAKTIAKQQQVDVNKLEILDIKVNELISRLHEYDLELLTDHHIISYWASRLNGRDVEVKTETYLFDEFISNVNIYAGSKKNYLIFDNNGQETFSCFLSVKSYPSDTTNRLFSELQKLAAEFTIYQHYITQDVSNSIKIIDEKIRRLGNLVRFNQTAVVQLEAVLERLQNEEIKLFHQIWNIQLFANTLDELNARVLEVQTTVERRNLLLLRETKNNEACFWSIFPGWEEMRIRKYPITSDNLSHFITFSSDNAGIDRNSWGNEPVCKFLTADGSVYNFSFHDSPDKESLGNTVIIGGAGQGKTTLISFLLSQSMRYQGFKCMAFDRGYGLKVFADVIGASYTDFTGAQQNINPLQMDIDHRTFLQSWLEGILKRDDDEDIATIGNALEKIFESAKKDRNLKNIADAFKKGGKGTIRNALNIWLPDGANGAYFNGKADALDFNTPFVFFDTTVLLDNPDVLGAMADYLFFRIKTKILQHPSPYAIFVDELNKYLASDQFAPKLKETAAEIRKTNGILVMAVQSAKTLFSNETYLEMKDNISTYILFPNANADSDHYKEHMGLNDAEFDWIKTGGSRQVMVKKTESETVILDVDLSALENYLKVFNSSSSVVRQVNQLQAEYPDTWLQEYLDEK